MSVSLEAVGRAVHFSGLGKEVREKDISVPSRSLETRIRFIHIRMYIEIYIEVM